MDVVRCDISKCIECIMQCFKYMLQVHIPATLHREPIVFVLNAVYQHVYTICILYDNIYVNSL